MSDGVFKFEDCLLKHFIRHEVWLPRCKEQLSEIRRGKKPKEQRRLKYFTFCAVGALDVLLLDREKIIRRSNAGEFDNVYFFDRDNELVIATRKRIPGAVGFPGDFINIVLQNGDIDTSAALSPPRDKEDVREVRQAQVRQAQLESFVSSFPFDVVNLDVEQYLYKPTEELPGNLTRAIRRILDWQTREGTSSSGKKYHINEFTLLFTTKVGPENLSDAYLHYLRDTCLRRNLEKFAELHDPYNARSGGRDVNRFFAEDFANAFKLAVPKSLIELALEHDWYIDSERGVEVYQFDRPTDGGGYTMLHMAMKLRRQSPDKHKRAPGQVVAEEAANASNEAIHKLFKGPVVAVEGKVTGALADNLKRDLDRLFEYREKYYPAAEKAD